MWSNCVVKQTTIQKYKFNKKLPKEKIKNHQQINQRKNTLLKKKEKNKEEIIRTKTKKKKIHGNKKSVN